MSCNWQGYILALVNNPKEGKPNFPLVTFPQLLARYLAGWYSMNPEQHLESSHPQDKGEITSVKE